VRAPCLGSPDHGKACGISVDRDARVIRDRQEFLRAAMDRAGRMPPIGAARQLVSVYNGGSMPTQPDHIFLTHPVELDGSEVEGGLASTNVNTSATIPVVVLWGAPQVGDLLVATSVGGRWVAERAVGGRTTICLTVCSPAIPVYGAVVTIKNGSTTVASGTTGTGGCVTLPVAGTYTVQVQVGGTSVYSAVRSLAADGTTTIALASNSGMVCCGSYAIPQNLTLTDAAGSLQFSYYPNYFYPIWYGGHSVSRLSCSVTTPNNVCVAAAPSQGPVKVCYQMICYAGSHPTFSIQRSWSWVYQQGTLTPIWYQDPSGFTPGQPCTTAPPASCGSPHTDTASFSADPSSPSPFALSGTPAAAAGNYTSDPVGSSVAISA
jgi:hypothetical protein